MTVIHPDDSISEALSERIIQAADEPVVNPRELKEIVTAVLIAKATNRRRTDEECAAVLAAAIIKRNLFAWGSVRNSIRAVNEYMAFVGRRPFLDGTAADERRIKILYYPHDDFRIGELTVQELAQCYTTYMENCNAL